MNMFPSCVPSLSHIRHTTYACVHRNVEEEMQRSLRPFATFKDLGGPRLVRLQVGGGGGGGVGGACVCVGGEGCIYQPKLNGGGLHV